MTDLDTQLGAWMADVRESYGIAQLLLAEQLQIEQSTVSKIEHGERRVSVALLLRWASALGVSDATVAKELAELRASFFPISGFWGD